MMKLMDDRARMTMGKNARQFIEENHIEEPFQLFFPLKTIASASNK
jgi:hypothetical protein